MPRHRVRAAATGALFALLLPVPLHGQGTFTPEAIARGATTVVEGRGPAAAPWNPALGMLWRGTADGILLPSVGAEEGPGAAHDREAGWLGVQSGPTLLYLHSRVQRWPAGQRGRELAYSQIDVSHSVPLDGAGPLGAVWAGVGLHLRHTHHDRVRWAAPDSMNVLSRDNVQEVGLDLGIVARPASWLLAGVSISNLVQVERGGTWTTGGPDALTVDSADGLSNEAPHAVGGNAPGWLRGAISANSSLGLWSVGVAVPYVNDDHPEALDAARWSIAVSSVSTRLSPRVEYSVDGLRRRAVGAGVEAGGCSFRVSGGIRYRLDPEPTWGAALAVSLGSCPDH